MNQPPAEFDRLADGYTAGMDDPVKAAIGGSAEAFLLAKIDLLRRALRARTALAPDNAALRMLDFGCGTGDFLALLSHAGFAWQSEGCDVADGMLAEARTRHPALGAPGRLWNCAGGSFPTERYDVITAVCVFHHIPPREWGARFAQLRAALRPGGRCYLFEHNPWNPLTRWIVARAPIDRNAVLLSPATARRAMLSAGFRVERPRFFLFLPPRWQPLRILERIGERLPFGGQYCLAGIGAAG